MIRTAVEEVERMGREKLIFGVGAACVAGCAMVSIAPLLLGVGLAGWQFGVVGAVTLSARALAVGAVHRRSRTAAVCRVDGGCGCQAAQADTASIRR